MPANKAGNRCHRSQQLIGRPHLYPSTAAKPPPQIDFEVHGAKQGQSGRQNHTCIRKRTMDHVTQRAFTLVELLVTIAFLGVLLGIAVPSFGSLIERNQQTAAINDLLSALNHARGLAINRREPISLCAGIDSCNATAKWRQSMLIFSDPNRNGQLDAGEQIHRIVTLPDHYHWNWSNFRNRNFMSYRANGMTDSLNGTYTLCNGNQAIRRLVINSTGRLRTESPENHSACN